MKGEEELLIDRLNKLEDIINTNNLVLKSLLDNQISLETHLQELIRPKTPDTLAVNGASKIDFVPINDIIYCSANLAYTNIISVGNNQVVATKSLNEYEGYLSGYSFFRISKSFLVNTNHIHSYNKRSGQVLMKNKDLLDVARRRKSDFLNTILIQ